jgi:sugar lactone lactonase YvrE
VPDSLRATPVLEQRAELGESPLWDQTAGVLWWIDWAQDIVYRSDIIRGITNSFPVGPSVAAVALSSRGRIAVALGHGYAELDPETSQVRELARAEDEENPTRMCDGKCDGRGRFWAGTMALDEQSPVGTLFVMETDGSVRRVLEGVTVSNGLCWSPDNATFYYIDTATNRIDSFEFDLDLGSITNRTTFVDIPTTEGAPDGLTIDVDGYLWVALWDGWQVRRYGPEGQLDATIDLPVARPTCCALGGPDFRDLFITTALPDSAGEREAQPLAGRVFRARAAAPGFPSHVCGFTLAAACDESPHTGPNAHPA